jgi:hypothetical protein
MEGAGVRTKEREQVRESAFPWHGTMEEKIAYLLRYATLAPSSHGSQPWWFSVVGNTLELRPAPRLRLRSADADGRELHISLGCALENLLIAAERFGFGHEVAYPAESETGLPAARVTLLSEETPSTCRPPELFDTIATRATNRGRYERRPVAESALAQLRECAVDDGVGLFLTGDPETRSQLRELVVRAGRQLVADAAWGRELASQLALASTPFVGVLHSGRDDRESRIRVGQAFERVSLMAARCGLSTQPLSRLVELLDMRRSLQALLPDPHTYAQHPFRLGYARAAVRPVARRPVRPVLA